MSDIFVYKGEGSSREAVDMLFQSLQETCLNYNVQLISPEDVRRGDWMRSAALFAIGGGYDRGYIRALKSDGLQNIKTYVEGGGSYLGICSGAYLACRRIEFDKGGELEVCGERDLRFFPGVAIGPTFPGFKYDSEKGAHASHISIGIPTKQLKSKLPEAGSDVNSKTYTVENSNCYTYFNGGCHFVFDDDVDNDVTVFSKYLNSPDGKQHPAILQCIVGKGTVVLSGVHIEYIVEKLNQDNKYLKDIIPKLKGSSQTRTLFYQILLKMLKLSKL